MYQLIHSLTVSDLFKRQLPVFVIAFFIAELFYKFHSFILETGAFLITWRLRHDYHQVWIARQIEHVAPRYDTIGSRRPSIPLQAQ